MHKTFCATGLSLLLASLSLAQGTYEPKAISSIKWRLPRGRIFIEPGKKLNLFLIVKDKSGKGITNLELQLGASAGSLSQALDLGGGRYKTSYRMPDQHHPQAVILHASIPGAPPPPAWTVLRLWSKIALPVNTDKPNVKVTLKLGKRNYGPETTDSDGSTTVNITIGPGEDHVLAVAEDAFGNRNTKHISIPIPPTTEILGLANRKTLPANGVDTVHIYLVAIKTDGSPLDRASFSKSCNQGRLSEVKRLHPGLYKIIYTAPAQMTKPTAEVTISKRGYPATNKIRLMFQLTPVESVQPTPSLTTADKKAETLGPFTQTDQQKDLHLTQYLPSWFSFGPSMGLVTNFARLFSILVSLEGIIELPLNQPHLHLSLSLGFRFGNDTEQLGLERQSLEIDLETIPVHVSLLYKLSAQKRFTLYAAIGGGFELVRWTLSRTPDIRERGYHATPGLLAYLGAELRIGKRGALHLKLGYLYAYLNDSSPSSFAAGLEGSRIKGNLGGMELSCGYQIYL